ncbi:MAG: hypothetical protein QNJ54_30360 [Prochloraceae cyanobacterium]|nr:hypothetical protein [Prochloraceae cyanobacterium]
MTLGTETWEYVNFVSGFGSDSHVVKICELLRIEGEILSVRIRKYGS